MCRDAGGEIKVYCSGRGDATIAEKVPGEHYYQQFVAKPRPENNQTPLWLQRKIKDRASAN